jgi:hypothetical protein
MDVRFEAGAGSPFGIPEPGAAVDSKILQKNVQEREIVFETDPGGSIRGVRQVVAGYFSWTAKLVNTVMVSAVDAAAPDS